MNLLKNRFLIGCICIVLAFVIGFVAVPLLTNKMNNKVSIVVLSRDVVKGQQITPDYVRNIDISESDMLYASGDYFSSVEDLRKNVYYASIDMKTNDVLIQSKVSRDKPYADQTYRELGDNEYAVSVSVNSLPQSVSAKIAVGDIVMPVLYADGASRINPNIMYLEVINIVNSTAEDINKQGDSASDIPSVVTFKVNLQQALDLVACENETSIHLSLVCRGDDYKKAQLLARQQSYLEANHPISPDAWFLYEDDRQIEDISADGNKQAEAAAVPAAEQAG